MDEAQFWRLFGSLIKEFRERRGYSQAKLGEMIGQSNTRISDIENARSIRRGVRDQTVTDLLDALDIPEYRFLPLYKRFNRLPPPALPVASRRVVYLSSFDVDDGVALLGFEASVLQLFAYGCFADTVSFQYSDALKNQHLLHAIKRFEMAFQMNEDWSARPLFKIYTNGKTETFVDYLATRRSFLKGQTHNLEAKSYDIANAEDGARDLDNFFSDVSLSSRTGSVTSAAVARMKRFFKGKRGPAHNSPAYSVAFRYWNEPQSFQTFKFKSDIYHAALHLDEGTSFYLNHKLRGDYHAANAQSVGALTDDEFVWAKEPIMTILDMLNMLAPLRPQIHEMGDLSTYLFTLRKDPWFRVLKDFYFDCTSKQEIAIFQYQLAHVLRDEPSQEWQVRVETAAIAIMKWLGSKR